MYGFDFVINVLWCNIVIGKLFCCWGWDCIVIIMIEEDNGVIEYCSYVYIGMEIFFWGGIFVEVIYCYCVFVC